jgi:hypothetical protein
MISDYKTTQQAIEHYEINMRKRAGETAQMTLEQTTSLHSGAALKNMLEMFKV